MKTSKPMNKILIVGQWFISEENGKIIIPGGTERYIYGLAKQLQNDGYEVMVLSATTNKEEIGVRVLDGLKVYKFRISEKLYGYCADFLSFVNTLKFIRRFNPDIVHVISARYRFALGAVAATKTMKKKVIFTITTLPSKEGRKWLPVFFDKISMVIFKRSDTIISLSKEMNTALLSSFFPKRLATIPSFSMKSYYRMIEKDANRLLFVGRLDEKKGIAFLIEALYFAKKEIPDVKLSIAGAGDLLDYLKEMVSTHGLEDNITFEGLLGDDALVNVYSKCEIFVFPSLKEGMPIVLLEAMSAGLPIIAFDIEPAVEALDHGKYGILVKKGDVKGLANAIIKLLKDDELRRYYSKMSLEKSKKYSQAEVVRQIEKIYSEIIEAHSCE